MRIFVENELQFIGVFQAMGILRTVHGMDPSGASPNRAQNPATIAAGKVN